MIFIDLYMFIDVTVGAPSRELSLICLPELSRGGTGLLLCETERTGFSCGGPEPTSSLQFGANSGVVSSLSSTIKCY